jgi:Transposase DDE domain group 1
MQTDQSRTAFTIADGAGHALVARPDQPKPTEFAPTMGEGTGILPGLPAVAGKPVHVGFDGGRLTSDGRILLLAAVERRLKIAERLAACIEDPRDPDRGVHQVAEMLATGRS